MANLHLVLYDGDRQVDSWDVDPRWDAIDVAEFTTEVGTDVYDYIRDYEEDDARHSDGRHPGQEDRLRAPDSQGGREATG
jgi:hypothetical protein